MSVEFDGLYSDMGRRSIVPVYVLRALLLQVLFSVRSERQPVEQIDYNLLFRWFVGLGTDACDVEPCGVLKENDRKRRSHLNRRTPGTRATPPA